MKIVVRSKYWGSHIQGHTFKPKRAPYTPYNVLLAQVDFDSRRRHRSQLGCCPHHGGRRVLELTESQFLDAHNGEWDLYHTKYRMDNKGNPTHDFYLLPSNQTSIDVEAAMKKDGWQLWGSCQACILRMDLEPLLKPFLQEKKRLGRIASHCHIFVVMDVAEDKNPPLQSSHARSNRYQFNKQRAMHSKEESSCCTAETATTISTEELSYLDQGSFTDQSSCTPCTSSPQRPQSPVRPPVHVQCNLGEAALDEDLVQEAMHDEVTVQDTTHQPDEPPTPLPQTHFLEPRQEPRPAWNAEEDFPALEASLDHFNQSKQAPGRHTQEDFPVLVQSLNRMSVWDGATASKLQTSTNAWGVVPKAGHSELGRCPVAA